MNGNGNDKIMHGQYHAWTMQWGLAAATAIFGVAAFSIPHYLLGLQ